MEVLHAHSIVDRIFPINNYENVMDPNLSIDSKNNVDFYMRSLIDSYFTKEKNSSKFLLYNYKYRSCTYKKGKESGKNSISYGNGRNRNNKSNNAENNSNNGNNNDNYDDGYDSDDEKKNNNFNSEEKENDKKKKKKSKKSNNSNDSDDSEEEEHEKNEKREDLENLDENNSLKENAEQPINENHYENVSNNGENDLNKNNASSLDNNDEGHNANTNGTEQTLNCTENLEESVNNDKENLDDPNIHKANENSDFSSEYKGSNDKPDTALTSNIQNEQNTQHFNTNLSVNKDFVTSGYINSTSTSHDNITSNNKLNYINDSNLYNIDKSLSKNSCSHDFNKAYTDKINVDRLQKQAFNGNNMYKKVENYLYLNKKKCTNHCYNVHADCINGSLKYVNKYTPVNYLRCGKNNCVNILDSIKKFDYHDLEKHVKNYDCAKVKKYFSNYDCTNIKKYTKNFDYANNIKKLIPNKNCPYYMKNVRNKLNLQGCRNNRANLGGCYKKYVSNNVNRVKLAIYNKGEGCLKNNPYCNEYLLNKDFYKLAANKCLDLGKVYSKKLLKSKGISNNQYIENINRYYKKQVSSLNKKIEKKKSFVQNYCNVLYFDCMGNTITSNDAFRRSSFDDYENNESNVLEPIRTLTEADMGIKSLYKTASFTTAKNYDIEEENDEEEKENYNVKRKDSSIKANKHNKSAESLLSYANIKSNCHVHFKEKQTHYLNTGINALKHLKRLIPSNGDTTNNEIIYDEKRNIYFDSEDNIFVYVNDNLYYNTKDKLYYNIDIDHDKNIPYEYVKDNVQKLYNYLSTEKYVPCKFIMRACFSLNKYLYNLLNVNKLALEYKEKKNLVEVIIK